MSIMRNLQKAHTAVVLDTFNGGTLANDLANLAVAAIMGGKTTKAFIDYMSLFADNPGELNRLIADADLEGRPWLEKSRAYIVSNAICDASTNTKTHKRVDPLIDEDISPEPGDIPKIIDIPEPCAE